MDDKTYRETLAAIGPHCQREAADGAAPSRRGRMNPLMTAMLVSALAMPGGTGK